MKAKKGQIALVAVSIIIIVVFLLLPKAPESALENIPERTSVDIKLEQAVQMVQSGGKPMEGILKIREISEQHPENVDAQLWLGVFSMESNQIDKAKNRFNNVLNLDNRNAVAHRYLGEISMQDSLFDQAIGHFEIVLEEDTSFHSALFYIGKSHEEKGNVDKAIEFYEEFLPHAQDTIVFNGVQGMISQLRNK